VRANLLAKNPNAIINGRLMGYGDYDTPEQNVPVTRPKYNWWELCMTINNNWGFQHRDTNWKTPSQIIALFADVVSHGGNLLLDIGPKEDGTIPEEQRNVLLELGNWNTKHDRAIFGSIPGIAQGHFYGPTTMSKDSTKLYLFLQGQTAGEIMIKGLDNAIQSIKVVGSEQSLSHKVVGKISWSPVPGLVYINIPEGVQDKYMTVLELQLDKPVKLYRGRGGFE
jgi:alpha-L-fucosidase